MGKYSVPEFIRNQKPKGTMVKKIKNRYYVYTFSSQKVAVTDTDGNRRWKTRTIMGDCIGQVTEADGFVPNEGHMTADVVTTRNYGDYAFVVAKANPTLELLQSVFQHDYALKIFSVAVIFFIEGFTYMKNMKDIFDLSYLKLIYDRISLGYESLHTLYKDLGTKHTRVRKFEKLMISNSSKRIAIDAHVIACT